MANYTSVTASNICDAAGNKLASGTVSFQATDAANQPLNFQVGGGGQVVTTPATAAIVAGAIAGGFQVADSANTSPAGILYRITITDTTLNRVVVTYSLVTVAGTTFNLDNYSQTGAAVLPPVGGSINGPLTVTGNFSVTGSIAGGPFIGSIAGVFTNTQMNEGWQALVNGANPATLFSGSQAGNFATEAVTGAIIVPVGATVHQVNGVAGYVQNNSSTMPLGGAVGVFGQSDCQVNNSFGWGANFVVESLASLTGVNLQALELDVNAHQNDVCIGMSIAGATAEATPSVSRAIWIKALNIGTNVPWQDGILFNTGSCNGSAIFIAPTATGNSHGSMPIVLEGTDAGGVARLASINVDLNGVIQLSPPNSQSVKVVGSGGVISSFFKSANANPAASGQLRFAHTDAISFRNNANTNDLLFGTDSNDRFNFAASIIVPTLTLTSAAPTVSAGQVGLGSTHATTVGAAGGATALPATPLGYLIANVDGTQVKIPYFNN